MSGGAGILLCYIHLDQCTSGCYLLQGGILILTGPSGCGKSATVQVLSMELGLRVQEWTNPTLTDPFTSRQHGD